jgi:hypothetical protein
LPYGYLTRPAFPGEVDYFKKNPTVSGMAAEDGRIVLNPFSLLSDKQREAVKVNESVRLFLRNSKFPLLFGVTPGQRSLFAKTPYGKRGAENDLRATIIGRILSGDRSAGPYTPEQLFHADMIHRSLLYGGRR